jgi:hypothetical protein
MSPLRPRVTSTHPKGDIREVSGAETMSPSPPMSPFVTLPFPTVTSKKARVANVLLAFMSPCHPFF